MTNDTINDDFIIKPISTSFDIREMRQLIAGWKMAGVSDSQIIKMQLLFFGEPAWMNLDKMYDSTRFIHIVKGMKFRTTTDFLEVLLKCKGFEFIWRNEQNEHTPSNLIAFYSPIWHEKKEAPEKDASNPEQGEDEVPQGDQPLQQSDRYITAKDIYYKKKNIQKKNISYISGRYDATRNYASLPSLNAAEREKAVDLAARELLQVICQNEDAYTEIVKPINEQTERIMPELYTNPNEHHPSNLATRFFFRNYIYPYLLNHPDKMMTITTTKGRCCWLRNLLQFEFMQKKIQLAVNDTRKYLKEHAEEMRRQNRPLSPHEYQDQKTGERFYDFIDPKDQSLKTEAIPHEAELRPSATARWNKFSKKWIETKQ